jgi:hypothetical protein
MRVTRGSKPEKSMLPACGRTTRSAKTTFSELARRVVLLVGIKGLAVDLGCQQGRVEKILRAGLIVGTLDRRFDKIEMRLRRCSDLCRMTRSRS